MDNNETTPLHLDSLLGEFMKPRVSQISEINTHMVMEFSSTGQVRRQCNITLVAMLMFCLIIKKTGP